MVTLQAARHHAVQSICCWMGPPDDMNHRVAGRLTSILLIVAHQVWELLIPRVVQDQVLVNVNEDDPPMAVFELVQAALICVQLGGLRGGPSCKPVICRQQEGGHCRCCELKNLLGPKTVLLLALATGAAAGGYKVRESQVKLLLK